MMGKKPSTGAAVQERQAAEWLSVSELAAFLKKSRSAVHKLWPGWTSRYGVRPVRFSGRKKGRLLFSRAEVEQMVDSWRIETGAGK